MKFLAVISLTLGSLSLILPTTTLAQSTDYATIQDRARAHRESFLKQQTTGSTIVDSASSDSIQNKIKSLEERILSLRQKTILASYDRVLTNTERYSEYLSGILNRLDSSLAELSTSGKDTTKVQNQANEASLLLDQASTTIAVARASTTAVFTSTDPGQTIRDIKMMIEEAVVKLGQVRDLLAEAIETAKTLSNE